MIDLGSLNQHQFQPGFNNLTIPFVVIPDELSTHTPLSIGQATEVAEKIRNSLAEPHLLKLAKTRQAEAMVQHQCSACLGVVLFLGHEASQHDLLKWADNAMYQAKAAGRNVIRFSKG